MAVGVAVRIGLLATTENHLDCDEATVATMALDILDGVRYPLFFYGNAYNGGGAMEAYLAAGAFALLGPSAVVFKGVVLLLWTAAALLLADVCRRWFAPRTALLAMLFFAVGTPFFLEWSLKGRGGFAETVLFTTVLLWLLEPPGFLARRPTLQALLAGVTAGIGLWASEMLLPMAGLVGGWIVVRRPSGRRLASALAIIGGALLGALPLLLFNLSNDAANLRETVLYRFGHNLIAGGGDFQPLSLPALSLSLRFVLGPAWWLLLAGGAVAGSRLMRGSAIRGRGLGRLLLLHTVVYTIGYWLAGLRSLPVPPSRLLYALYPGLSVLLGPAADWGERRGLRRGLSLLAVAVWLLLSLSALGTWVRTGLPREHGSWRGKWSLVDAERLRALLRARRTGIVYTNYWTGWPLALSERIAARRECRPPAFAGEIRIPPRSLPAGIPVAFVLIADSPVLQTVEQLLRQRQMQYQRIPLDDLVILAGLDSAAVHTDNGFPPDVSIGAWPAPPKQADGFN